MIEGEDPLVVRYCLRQATRITRPRNGKLFRLMSQHIIPPRKKEADIACSQVILEPPAPINLRQKCDMVAERLAL